VLAGTHSNCQRYCHITAESGTHACVCVCIYCVYSLALSPLRERIAQAKTLSADSSSSSDNSTTSAAQQ
jgi:hypothetical protein